MSLLHLEKNDFEEKVLKNNKLTLVDFFGTWCMPCKMLSPILEEVSESLGEKIDIVKVDIDKFPEIAKRYGVMAVPTMILFKDEKEIDKMVGLKQADDIIKILNQNL